jgi:DNA processing protein
MSERSTKENELMHAIGLTLIEGIGPVLAKKLIAWCGSAEAVFREKKQWLLKIPDIGPGRVEKLSSEVLSRAEEEMKFIDKNEISVHYFTDKSYSQRLKYCEDSPLILFSRGNIDLNAERFIALVGTRTPTNYGREMAQCIIEELASKNIIAVSGLAYGIDITVHRTCVQNNVPTIGVLGHGLDRLYPYAHRSVAEKMTDRGALLTEFISGTNPDRENFPKRNRIVAGMCDATIVIESGVKGGSVITAMLANDYNRDVFAFPGRANDEQSGGCNRLIKLNRAALIESAEDFIEMMGWNENNKVTMAQQQSLFLELEGDEEKIYSLLKEKGELEIDLIALETGIAISKVSSLLLQLEFKSAVKSKPGKKYSAT